MTGFLILTAGLLLWYGMNTQHTPAPVTASIRDANSAITVTGSSAVRVQPDRVVVLFGVSTFASTPSASQAENATLSKAVMEAIRAQGIQDKHIATANLTIQPRYEDYDRNVISGYGAHNTIAVTLRDVTKLEGVLIAALEAGASSVEGVEFSVTNLRQLRDQARELAVQAALEKADDMAGAAGVELGQVTHIHEDSWYDGYFGGYRGGRQWTNVQNVVQDLGDEGALVLEDGSISLGQIVVKAQVSLTARLIPRQ